MKRIVYCPVCKKSLGRYHGNQSGEPVRDHLYEFHPVEYKEIVTMVNAIDHLYELLKPFDVTHWNKYLYHHNVKLERELRNIPPMTDEQRKELVRKIKEQE